MITGRSDRTFVAAANAQMAAMDRAAEKYGRECEICAGVIYLCPDCKRPITMHSHENDYLCDCQDPALDAIYAEGGCSSVARSTSRFVNPIRATDGARIIGHGYPGPIKVQP